MKNAKGKVWTEVVPPDGEYKGFWGGYNVRFTINDQNFEFESESGVRGMNIPVIVSVKNGVVTFEANNA